ncbi:hypothetical protein QVD17_37105 [Tagetes erecta]|uniref:Uncharacterized protein n=1 Tax=Tagetes erecta TaxID=13708 RepID=A0AAD8NJS1_TARER|nr:hypothetical protein QVD17_37105 [Tagetes erecta]
MSETLNRHNCGTNARSASSKKTLNPNDSRCSLDPSSPIITAQSQCCFNFLCEEPKVRSISITDFKKGLYLLGLLSCQCSLDFVGNTSYCKLCFFPNRE